MKARLQKAIADSGLCSRRKAEAMISDGRVSVNGRVARLGQTVETGSDDIRVDGRALASVEKVYFMLNKPPGFECTLRSTTGKPLASSLVRTDARIFPVGRLDTDSRGLLILTNDGEFANLIIHPSHSVEKEYEAMVGRRVPDEVIDALTSGVMLGATRTRPCRVEVIERTGSGTLLRFVLHEGRKRQIRHMLETFGFRVTDLRRTRMGDISLGRLAEGSFRRLTDAEVRALLNAAARK